MDNYEDVMKKTRGDGTFGRRLAAVIIASSVCGGVNVMLGVFLTVVPPHRCYLPQDDIFMNESLQNNNISIPLNDDGGFSQCTIYTLENEKGNSSRNEVECDKWTYYDLDQDNLWTASMEFGWICSYEWMGPLLMSLQIAGYMLGSLLGGILSDRFGRKWTYRTAVCLRNVLCVAAAFSLNGITLYAVFGAMFTADIIVATSGSVLAHECLEGGLRQLVSMIIVGSYSAGTLLLPLYAYLLPNWRHLTAAVGLTGVILIPLTYYIVESPRWLIFGGRTKEADAVLRNIAKVNKVTQEDCDLALKDHFEELHQMIDDKEINNNDTKECITKASRKENLTIWSLFKSRCLFIRFLILSFAWFAVNMGYYGITFNTNNLAGNRFINCFLSGAVEIPGTLLCFLLLRRIGGRITFVLIMSIGTVFIVTSPLFQTYWSIMGTMAALCGKLCFIGSFSIVYALTGEFFPTMIRNQALGSCSFIARFAGISSPYVFFLGNIHKFLPYFIIGGISALSALCAYNLPETKGLPIPDTYAEAKDLEKSRPIGICKIRSARKTTTSDEEDRSFV